MGSFEETSEVAAKNDATSEGNDHPSTEVVKQEPDVITASLEDLQTGEQRQVLDTVAQVRKCGLDSILELPQLVVCGDQSAEILLRRAPTTSLTIKIIPDDKRSSDEKKSIQAFSKSITNFDELPEVMSAATAAMDVQHSQISDPKPKAFARDVLSIEIEGPTRPQLALVDIPGLIQTDTKGVTKADVEMVAEITHQYISSSRTICLAVVSAANDYANQSILQKVREVDKDGDRTLGIITRPDRLDAGSGMETSFIGLANNEDVLFKLGWHVLKNRKFYERDFSLEERNVAEATYFRNSNFRCLPDSCKGIDTLRSRLSLLLFEHVKHELPKLRVDLEEALSAAKKQLSTMGESRTKTSECKDFLSQLSLEYYETCKAAVNGHYEGEYFHIGTSNDFSPTCPTSLRRLRAVVQLMNIGFANTIRVKGHKYQINLSDEPKTFALRKHESIKKVQNESPTVSASPYRLNRMKALAWAQRGLVRTRGKELTSKFNPLLVGELFWEQCSNWELLAENYLDEVWDACFNFLNMMLEDKCPNDVISCLRVSIIQDSLKARRDGALQELKKTMEDIKCYPIDYNHYYTDTVNAQRQERQKKALRDSIEESTDMLFDAKAATNINQAVEAYSKRTDPNMENVSCEEALTCLLAIYKVSEKTFVANVTTQVIERHIIRGIEKIFSPVVVSKLADEEVEKIASEPAAAKRQRNFLEDRIQKLEAGKVIFRGVLASAAL